MVGLIVTLTPVKIKKLQKDLQKERSIVNRKVRVSRAVQENIQANPTQRSKFQTD